MDVIESDHKPVRCKLNVEIAHVNRSTRRQEFGKIFQQNDKIREALQELHCVPDITFNTDKIVLQNQESYNLKITNRSGKDKAFYEIICKGQSTVMEDEKQLDYRSRGSLGFPRWLEVRCSNLHCLTDTTWGWLYSLFFGKKKHTIFF